MIQLKDLTPTYVQSQLKSNYEEFSHIEFTEVYDNIQQDIYKGGSSSGLIAYLTKKSKANIFDNVALCFRFKDTSHTKELLSQLENFNNSLKKEINNGLITQEELDNSLHWRSIERCINILGMPLIPDNNFFSISVYYVKCNQIDDSSFRVSIGQHRTKRQTDLVNDDVVEPLIQLKDALLSALSYTQEKNLTELEQGYTEALEAFETINMFMLSQLNSLDIEELKSLCNKTIVKRLNNQNRDLPNVKAITDVKYELYGRIAYTSNSIKKNVLVNLNARIKSAPAKSREKQVLQHFKESVEPYIEELLKIHEELQPYINCPYQGAPPKLVVDAINADMESGDNNEKLRIINEVSVLTKALEQSSKSLNAAYHDMLFNAYSE